MNKLARSAAEASLRLVAIACVAMAALWVLGYNGAHIIDPDFAAGTDDLVTAPSLRSWGALPSAPISLSDREDNDALYDVSRDLGAMDGGIEPRGYAEVSFGPRLQFFTPPAGERWAYVIIHAATWLGIAAVAWLLAGVARRRGGSPFTSSNARRLALAGGVLGIGSIVSSIGQHLVLGRMIASSTVAVRVDQISYDLFSLPWGGIASGGALLAIAHVWRRGVALEEDVKGLV